MDPDRLAGMTCSVLGEGDRVEAVELLTEAFCLGDPVEAALGITPDEFRVMVDLELEPAQHNGLGMVARDTGSGRLLGALIAVDALADSVDGRGRISRKFQPISEISHQLHEHYVNGREIRPGTCLYIFMIGVRPDLAGQGLGKRLIGEVLRHARRKGYGSAFVLATNLASAHAFERQGFRTLRMVDYRTYQFRNRLVFASITAHPGVALMARDSLD
jgi:GNAT superfamily N-acetyltransferase